MDKIIELTNIWYEYVEQDHHKDKDCKFFIEIEYSYGQPPVFRISHDAYIGDSLNPEENVFYTYEHAEKALESFLIDKLTKARDHADIVCYTSENYEKEIVDQAKWLQNNFN